MATLIETARRRDIGIEIPEFIGELNVFAGGLDGKIKIVDLFDPSGVPKNPPQGWLAQLSRLELNQKAILNSTLGSARVNGFETIDSIRILTIEEIITKSASLSLNTFRSISLKRAALLKTLFDDSTADFKIS